MIIKLQDYKIKRLQNDQLNKILNLTFKRSHILGNQTFWRKTSIRQGRNIIKFQFWNIWNILKYSGISGISK